ncbi:17-beta-hydroxysteroid dehydrogenase type 2 isoform X2 [Castor canadensis]|uniref:17-beta-hydroxysteroid dehydrogenase type 2 isoform X2 n=1 Tax=Castor canadensis TaxID=51338 RepID=A0AC58L3E3_CASCN
MSMFFSEAAWLCLSVTAVLGSTVLCTYKCPAQLQSRVVCLAVLWGGACLLGLSFFWSLILFCLSCFLLYMSSGEEFLPVDGKAVLVTGTDTGIGHALAKHLDKLGFTVFAGVLDERGSGAEELRKTCSNFLSVLQMDVTKPEQIKDAHHKVIEKMQDKGLWAVVNNAGIIHFPIDGELIPMDDYKKCMAVNFFGAVEVTKAFLPLLRKSKGRLVTISSMGGLMGTSDMWDKMEKNVLDQLPQEVQEDYGQDYLFLNKDFLRLMSAQSSPDFTPVLQDVQHAISAKSPSPFYAPGKLAYLWVCFASFSPTCLFDYIMQKTFGQGCIMPRALSVAD